MAHRDPADDEASGTKVAQAPLSTRCRFSVSAEGRAERAKVYLERRCIFKKLDKSHSGLKA